VTPPAAEMLAIERAPLLPTATGTPCVQDPDLWFSSAAADQARAVRLCGACPLRGPCALGARERRERYGVWGGETSSDRGGAGQQREGDRRGR